MGALVQIPYQPECWVTPVLLTRLQDANRRAGHNIPINGADGAWRSQAQQIVFWNAYQAYLHGGPYAPIASNPYTGQRNHMRGAAVDIERYSDRQYMLAAGFLPDPDEWWHFNVPGWENMPIIPDNTTASGGNSTPIPEDDMSQQAENEIHMMWQWMGGGSASQTTVFFDMQQILAKIKAVTDQLANGQGAVHTKLDDLKYITNDPSVGIRARVASVQAEITKIENELATIIAALPKPTS